MITAVSYNTEKGHIYAIITRDAIELGQQVEISISANAFYKYLPNAGEQVQIDLTPYCESSLRSMGDMLNTLQANALTFGISEGIAVIPDVERVQGYCLYYKNADTSDHGILTKLPYLQISDGGSLLLSLKIPDDYQEQLQCGDAKITITPSGALEDLAIVRVKPTIRTSVLTISNNMGYGAVSIPIRIVPSGMNTRRLVWINEIGGIDSWSFEFLRESSFATSSEVFYSSKGYTRTNRISERAHIIETRELDDITASVVAYVIASPEVYLEKEGTLVPIDIATEECRTYSDTELSSIQVAYRLKQREL